MTTLLERFEVYVDKTGNVCIAQQDMNEDCFVAMPPDQVDLLVTVLREKQKEAVEFRRTQFGDF